MQPPAADPLNPLNLAVIEPPKPGTASMSESVTKRCDDKLALPTSLRLPLRLHLISNISTEHLLETKTCNIPCFMLSQTRNTDFVGRGDILEQIDQHLLPRKMPDTDNMQSTRLFALCGMGGIGKTDLAVEYAYSRRRHFGAIFWLEAGVISQLASDFARIATVLGLQAPEEADSLESSIEIAKAWLTRQRAAEDGVHADWLLIFDNADNLDNIIDYVPYHGNGSVLVTSRDPFAKEHFFSNGFGVDLEPLSTVDSAILLRRLITDTEEGESSDEQDASVELASHLDGLPLAMTQMAGFIRRRHLSIREFVTLYANDARYAEIHGVCHPAQQQRYGYTLATAYNFQGLSSQATRLLQLLAFMNPDRVQEYIFVDSAASKGEPGRRHSWTASAFESARYELLACSIIKRNIHKKELWIHRLIQAEVRTMLGEECRCRVFKDAVTLLAEVWPPGDTCSQKIKRWAVCEELLPHLERSYQLYIEYSEAWEQFEVDPTLPTLLNEAAV